MKKILAFITALCMLRCSGDPEIVNTAPSNYEVSIDSIGSNFTEISWSQSFTSQTGNVTYSISLEGENLLTRTLNRFYRFKNLDPFTEYNGKIIAISPNGQEYSVPFSFNTIGNSPPSNFKVTHITSSNVTINLNWTEAIDPEGESVFYDIFLDDQLVTSNLNNQYYTIKGLKANTNYTIEIIDKDNNDKAVSITISYKTKDGIYTGDVDLRSQSQVEEFGALGYVEITGNLNIDSLGFDSDINDLSHLQSIKIVRGYFSISFLKKLNDLSGLNIEFVGKSIRIKSNDGLKSIDLKKLTHVLGSLEIERNSYLNDISGMNNLTQIGSSLNIYNNGVKSINGFNNLKTVETIYINTNFNLTEIIGFSILKTLKRDLNLSKNNSLGLINAFKNLEQSGRIFIRETSIPNLDSFTKLNNVVSEFEIVKNNYLENIKGLKNLSSMTYGDLIISANPNIISLEGLENFNETGGEIEILSNKNLSDFCGIVNIVKSLDSNYDLSIRNNKNNPTYNDLINENCK